GGPAGGAADAVRIAIAVEVGVEVAAGSGDVDVAAVIRVGRTPAIAVDGADGDHALVGGRIEGAAVAVVAGGGNDDHAALSRLMDQFLLGIGPATAAQAEIDDVGAAFRPAAAVVGQPDGVAACLLHVVTGGAALAEHAQRHDAGAPGNAGDADAVAGSGSDGAGHMRAVEGAAALGLVAGVIGVRVDAVAVERARAVADEIVAIDEDALQIRVVAQH